MIMVTRGQGVLTHLIASHQPQTRPADRPYLVTFHQPLFSPFCPETALIVFLNFVVWFDQTAQYIVPCQESHSQA